MSVPVPNGGGAVMAHQEKESSNTESSHSQQSSRRVTYDSLMRRQCHIALPAAFVSYLVIHFLLSAQNFVCNERSHPPPASWTHHVATAVAACFMLASIHYFTVGYCFFGGSLKGAGESDMEHPRSVSFAAATLTAISCISTTSSILGNYGPFCIDSLGVETLRNQWAEWMVALPLLGYIAIAVEDKPALTTEDIFILVLMFLTIFFGFAMNLFPSTGYEMTGFLFYTLSSICMGSNVFMAVVSDNQLARLMSRNSLIITDDWQAARLFRKSRLAWLLVSTLPTFAVIHMLNHFKIIDHDLLMAGNLIFGVLTKLIFTGVLSYEALAVQMTLERRANESRRRFLRYVFHEVRVPLNTITMGLSVLENECKETFEPHSVPHDVLMMMTGAAGFMNDTLNDVLSMSKIEDGSMTLTMQSFKLESLVSGAMVVIKGQARSKEILIDIDTSEARSQEYKWTFSGDRFRLEHVIVNFLSNAIKFSPEGSVVTVKVVLKDESPPQPVVIGDSQRPPKKAIDGDSNSDAAAKPVEKVRTVTILVRDQGVGISPENQKKLFVPFSQINSHELQQGRGTGLGLVLAKEIVEMHGGHVILESEEGKGSTFGFSLKLSVVEGQEEDKVNAKTEELALGVLKMVVTKSAISRVNSAERLELTLSSPSLSRNRSGTSTPVIEGQYPLTTGVMTFDNYRMGDLETDYINSEQRFGTADGRFLGTDAETHLPDNFRRILKPVSSSGSLSTLLESVEETLSRSANHSRIPSSRVSRTATRAGSVSPGGSGSSSSQRGGGTGRTVAFAVAAAAPVPVPAPAPEPEPPVETAWRVVPERGSSSLDELSLKKKKYLLVDDTISNCKMLRMLLSRHKIDCELAHDGQQAIDIVKDRGSDFDLIFMDQTMPIKSGLEATPEIRALGFPGLIIGLTGNALDDDIDRFLQAGVDSVFAKPFTDSKLSIILTLVEKYGSLSTPEIKQALAQVTTTA